MFLHHNFVLTARKHKKKLAIIDCSTGSRVTYSRALTASIILADKFDKYEKGFTGIMLPTSAGCALSILGVIMSGRTPAMINYSTDAAANAEYAKSKCAFKTIITSRALLKKLNCPKVDGMVFIEDIMQSISPFEKAKAALKAKLPCSLLLKGTRAGDMDDNATILFTSGSEKDPKAVQLTHRNIISNIKGITDAIDVTERDRFLAILPYFHVFGLTVCLWLPFYLGATIITHTNPLDLKGICNTAREEKPTVMVGTPSFMQGYLRKSSPGDFKSVLVAVVGADKCPEQLREGFLNKHGLPLYEGYGTTETSPVVSVNRPGADRPGSIGKTIPDVTVKIENYKTGEECAPGETGKILVKGDLVMKGYFDDLEETSLRIRDGWYDTGDMGYIDEDGYIWHAGRLKRFAKIGGEMISLVNIETVIEKLLPEDMECCVVEIPDPVKGARIAVAVNREIDEKKILKAMSKKLPNIALPRHFLVFEDLPVMGSGKIDFRAVTEMVRNRLAM
jgi:acyl-[acyl-carrier-protein]-phospholipid O-acyltransferase/long-chain-fatty-acid--[acyl-carrier-protein] ligase